MLQRFAPSPSGFLHLGHAYSALIMQDLTRASNGRLLLRIEDIDTPRCKPMFEDAIYEDLRWLGIEWHGEVLRQSSRSDAYAQAVTDLWTRGLLFACDCTRAQAASERSILSAPQEGDGAAQPIYSGICREKTGRQAPAPIPSNMALRLNSKALPDVRLSFTETGMKTDTDERGQVDFTTRDLVREFGDCVLARKDIGISYHLAVVLDDAFQGITHITRGEDLFEQTKLHVMLQHLLGLPTPTYHHHRLIRDENGKRLAKRHDALALRVLREQGLVRQDVLERLGFER